MAGNVQTLLTSAPATERGPYEKTSTMLPPTWIVSTTTFTSALTLPVVSGCWAWIVQTRLIVGSVRSWAAARLNGVGALTHGTCWPLYIPVAAKARVYEAGAGRLSMPREIVELGFGTGMEPLATSAPPEVLRS